MYANFIYLLLLSENKVVNITFYDVKPWEERYLSSRLKGNRLKFIAESLSVKNVDSKADVISVFISSKVDKGLLAKFSKLRLITARSTGFDNIDLKSAKSRKVEVCNVPYYGENTVAEHTFGLILDLSRNIHKSYVRTLKGDFSIEGLTGFDLKGKTIGIVGGGRIGLHVARLARAFGMHVRVYDVRRDDFLSEVLNFKYLSLDELLKVSDIVSLHVPYVKATHHLMDEDSFSKMKRGAILVNTARGALVDTDALYRALKSKRLGGAALDVIEGEDLIKEEHQLLDNVGNQENWREVVRNHEIFSMDNVLFTPHNAFNSKEALVRILDATVDNIECFLKGDVKNSVLR